MKQDPLNSKFVEHVLKYRPDSVTAQLAKEVESLRRERTQLEDIIVKRTLEESIALIKL